MLWKARPQLISGRGAIDGGGGSLAPSGLTGLIGWWDASVFASLSLTGSNITAVADQSGAGNTIITYNASPTYSATGFNSKPAMVFTSSAALKKASFAFGTGSTLTAFFVGTYNNSTGAFGRAISYFAGGSNDADNNTSFLVARDNSNNNVTLYRNANTAIRATGTPPTNFRCIATVDSSGVMKMYINGVSTTGSTLNTAFGASGPLAIGMAAYAVTSWWEGAMGEVGLATGFTNSTDVGRLDTYLQSKWGL